MAQKIKFQLPSDAELRDIIAQAERMRAETLAAMFRAIGKRVVGAVKTMRPKRTVFTH